MVPNASTDHTKPPSLLATPLPTLCYLWEGGQRIRMEGGTLVKVIMVLRHRLWTLHTHLSRTRVSNNVVLAKGTQRFERPHQTPLLTSNPPSHAMLLVGRGATYTYGGWDPSRSDYGR